MGERRVRNAKVGGSIPPGSTKPLLLFKHLKNHRLYFWCPISVASSFYSDDVMTRLDLEDPYHGLRKGEMI